MSEHLISPVALIHTPYQQKFAIPRQPGLVSAAEATLELLPPYDNPECVRGIEAFSHLWLLFKFHQTAEQGWKPLVRPPRLGGNTKVGVFASRSTFRPNAMGLSVVKLLAVDITHGRASLRLQGVDLVNGTPIYDIKPYLPYSDAINEAAGGFADSRPNSEMTVLFTPEAAQQLAHHQQRYANLQLLIEQVLQQDPRPAYKQRVVASQNYGMALYDLNIKYRVEAKITEVLEIYSD
ncbi:tRNA (N6-threonylcarbamoyladenosine(37)-N6)-methyltransferase TrmO [Corallincola luteus]|uniref:tRNA (N6-threonylcarbamoyladenosine(37)-N6)-methyltransferase TrmO n=1 Tax=Corallincola luteus TaxID=1775177 RepID=A0ABY2AJP3_9GAMM|nr:tRNA (N6-threonylcarbamoyladenosine(37)-N6)-methyltransferase TrmO [Corallincola luteus]TCI03026.1 tRNA (N6-threonylcarbamoyladenosine(37)-N6)-methyltransferase TrmO [Corallincola luteus]